MSNKKNSIYIDKIILFVVIFVSLIICISIAKPKQDLALEDSEIVESLKYVESLSTAEYNAFIERYKEIHPEAFECSKMELPLNFENIKSIYVDTASGKVTKRLYIMSEIDDTYRLKLKDYIKGINQIGKEANKVDYISVSEEDLMYKFTFTFDYVIEDYHILNTQNEITVSLYKGNKMKVENNYDESIVYYKGK